MQEAEPKNPFIKPKGKEAKTVIRERKHRKPKDGDKRGGVGGTKNLLTQQNI